MISIRNRLIATIFGVLVFSIAMIDLFVFHYVHEEFTEMQDGSLKQVAVSVSSYNYEVDDYGVNTRTSLEEEEEFLIQVWENTQLIYTSHPLINLPLQKGNGYGNYKLKKEDLRYYQYSAGKRMIQVAQSLDERIEMEDDIMKIFIIPTFLALPVIIILIHIVIGHGLRPLLLISNKMRERGAHNLSPIDINNIPYEVFPLIQSLNQLLRRLEDSLKLQRQFTADAAHELRTPLTAIRLQLDLLERAENEEERKEVEHHLKSAINRSTNLIESLLLLARHEPEALETGSGEVNLSFIIKTVFDDLQPLANNKGQTFLLSDKSNNAVINAQPHQLSTMFENLIQHAILYTQEKGRIEIELTSEQKHIIISVSDNGPGIKKEEQKRVFDRF